MSQAYRYRLGFCFIVDEMTSLSIPTKPPMLYSTLFLTVIATNSMKKIILFIALGLFSLQSYAQYDYQSGVIPINGINFKIYRDAIHVGVDNTTNVFPESTLPMFQGANHEFCADADFDKMGMIALKGVFNQVFSAARRADFAAKPYFHVVIYGNQVGKIQEVSFRFHVGSMVTPQELYQLETGLKALPALNYKYTNCTNVNYRVTGYTFYINELK
jgi:hypothetical protein